MYKCFSAASMHVTVFIISVLYFNKMKTVLCGLKNLVSGTVTHIFVLV